jgi:hypothetical protein
LERPTSFPWRKGSPPIERIMKKTIANDDPEDWDRPEQAAKDETGHTLRVPGS